MDRVAGVPSPLRQRAHLSTGTIQAKLEGSPSQGRDVGSARIYNWASWETREACSGHHWPLERRGTQNFTMHSLLPEDCANYTCRRRRTTTGRFPSWCWTITFRNADDAPEKSIGELHDAADLPRRAQGRRHVGGTLAFHELERPARRQEGDVGRLRPR